MEQRAKFSAAPTQVPSISSPAPRCTSRPKLHLRSAVRSFWPPLFTVFRGACKKSFQVGCHPQSVLFPAPLTTPQWLRSGDSTLFAFVFPAFVRHPLHPIVTQLPWKSGAAVARKGFDDKDPLRLKSAKSARSKAKREREKVSFFFCRPRKESFEKR